MEEVAVYLHYNLVHCSFVVPESVDEYLQHGAVCILVLSRSHYKQGCELVAVVDSEDEYLHKHSISEGVLHTFFY